MNSFKLHVDSKNFNKFFEHKLWKIYFLTKDLNSDFWDLITRKKVIYFFFPNPFISLFPFYVGQTENFKTRFRDHKEKYGLNAEKILILESTSYMTGDEIKYYEFQFINELKKQKISLKNKSLKHWHDLPDLMKKECEKTFEELKIIINSCLSFELFKKVHSKNDFTKFNPFYPEPKKIDENISKDEKENSSQIDLFFLKNKNLYDAKARFLIKNDVNPKVVEKIEIIAGSWVSENQWNKYKIKKRKYFEKNVKTIKLSSEIENENDRYIFKKNSFVFKSVSGAANFFIPYNVNGFDSWKKIDLKTGKKISLNQYLGRKKLIKKSN